MSKSSLDEMVEFVKLDSRLDLKYICLDHLLGLSGTEDGVSLLLNNEQIIQNIIELTNDRVPEIPRNALLLLINITAQPEGSTEILKYKPSTHKNIIELLISYILNPQKRDVDAVCMLLSNLTGVVNNELELCIDSFMPHLNDILNAFVNIEFNTVHFELHHLAPVFSNLTRSPRIRKWLMEENPHIPLIKLLPFCKYEQSNIRRVGIVNMIRNLCIDTQYHESLLKPEIDLLTYVLYPLMGNEDYSDEEMDTLPLSLQYLSKEKLRESNIDVRKFILETLNKLCSKRHCREILRENGVYYILREYHKWEEVPQVRLVCENVIDILIQKEDEVGADDLSTVEVPQEMQKKFNKMDEEYLKSME